MINKISGLRGLLRDFNSQKNVKISVLNCAFSVFKSLYLLIIT